MLLQALEWIRRRFCSEEGMGTIEIVIIIAVLVALAFLFNTFARGFFNDVTSGVRTNSNIDSLFQP